MWSRAPCCLKISTPDQVLLGTRCRSLPPHSCSPLLYARSISMTAERVCPICYKRIGQGAAFVAFPSGGVAHYSCYASAGGEGRASGAPAAAPIEV